MSTFQMVFAAAEMLSKGVDISKFDSRSSFLGYIGTLSDTFSINVDKATQELFNLESSVLVRENRIVWAEKKPAKDFKPDLTLYIDKVKDIMKVLYELNFESFGEFNEEIFLPNFKEYIAELDKNFDDKLLMMEKLSRQNTNAALKIFLALFNYRNDYSKKLYYDSAEDKDFSIIDAEGPVYDNRKYIFFKPSDIKKIEKLMSSAGYSITDAQRNMKAFVISKNVYDYFWASYGNTFQSCFALSSEYNYLYGYVPFAIAPESFICYATTGSVNKIPIISGSQFLCPNMLFRCWGYADTQKNLLIDKRYKGSDTQSLQFIKTVLQVLSQKIKMLDDEGLDTKPERKLYNNGNGIYQAYKDVSGKFYADSLRLGDGKVTFKYAGGMSGVGDTGAPWSNKYSRFTDYASSISKVSETLTLDKPWKVVNGELFNPKICPVTGLPISEELDKSPYAKYFTKNCSSSLIITYLEGYVFLDTSTVEDAKISREHFYIAERGCSREYAGGCLWIGGYSTAGNKRTISLKTLKEMLKGYFDELGFDGILLRYFDGAECKYQFYKGK